VVVDLLARVVGPARGRDRPVAGDTDVEVDVLEDLVLVDRQGDRLPLGRVAEGRRPGVELHAVEADRGCVPVDELGVGLDGGDVLGGDDSGDVDVAGLERRQDRVDVGDGPGGDAVEVG